MNLSAYDVSMVTQDVIEKVGFEVSEENAVDPNSENLQSVGYGEDGTSLPFEFSVKTFSESLKNDSSTDEISEAIKGAASYAIENLKAFELLTKVLSSRVAHLFDDYVQVNKVEETHLTSANFTKTTSKLHELLATKEYLHDIMTAFHFIFKTGHTLHVVSDV